MDIIVNDTNIFIDLHSVGLLGALCELPYDVRTVDLVVEEIINPEQTEAISKLITGGKIKVESFNPNELDEIIAEHSNVPGNISIPDCSVCYYARKHSVSVAMNVVSMLRMRPLPYVKVFNFYYLDFFSKCAHYIISWIQQCFLLLPLIFRTSPRLTRQECRR